MFFKKMIQAFLRSIAIPAMVLMPLIGHSQFMPVGVNVIMNPPNSPFISDYYSLESNAFQSFITLNDLNEPTWDVRLVVTIEGQGLVIETKRSFIPLQPISLIAGVPVIIQGADLTEYMNVNNVNLQGITAATLNQNGKLPEGLYNFCIEVLDYRSGVPLSIKSCGTAFIFYENPPVLLVPESETALQPSDPQNIFFHWQMAGGASPTIAATSQYKLFVYELQDENENPYYAVQNSKALLIYESDFQQTTSQTIDFGMSNSAPLTPGKRYIYRVRAVDADLKNIYKNDGYSEYGWFFYGYPSDGVLNISAPLDKHIYTKIENKIFNWTTSNKGIPGQEYEYMIFFKEKNIGQTNEQAMENNPEWLLVNQPATTSMNGGDFLLTQELDPGQNYVWQVKAMTGIQQVAESPIYEFFAPSVMDQFMAGNFPVKIVTMNDFTKVGNNYTNVSGKGRIQLSEDPSDVIDADFTNIRIDDLAGTMIMTQGTFNFDLSSREPNELEPLVAENGAAKFYYENGVVNSQGVKINGHIEWPFPHATTSGELEKLTTQDALFTLNSSFKLNGAATLGEAKDFNLLEPHEMVIKLDANTEISVSSDKYNLKMNGNILVSDEVLTSSGTPYSIKIMQQPQLYYFNANNLLVYSSNFLKPIQNMNIGFMPKSAVIDLSESTSPGKKENEPSWKGIYFEEFQVRLFQSEFDGTNQVLIPGNIDYHEDQTIHDFWIANQGLHLKYDFTTTETDVFFNRFRTTIDGKIRIEDNEVSNSNFRGNIKIPVISDQDLFGFEIPLNTQGLQLGYLYEDLSLRSIAFNPFGGENRIDVTINRAVFADNERLDLEINAEVAAFGCTITGINDFRIYGDNVIGVGGRNGSKKLDNRVSGEYNNYTVYITDVGASLFNGNFVFSYKAEMDMGEDVVGADGPPVLSVSSISPAGDDVELPVYSVSTPQPEPAIAVPTDPEAATSQTLVAVDLFIAINNSIVELEGYLKIRANDPVWGNSFSGGINGKIKVPTEIQCGANMIMGNREGLKFWYFDAWFNDTQGMGLKVGPLFNITAMEGRIYHHMSIQDGQFMPDANLAFGGALYLQIIDPSGGRMVAADIGAELKVYEDGEFTIGMKGDVAVLNKTQRTAGPAGSLSAVGEAALAEVVESIGPLSLSVEVGGGTLTVTAESLKKGSLDYAKGDMKVGFDIDVTAKPGVGFSFEKGGNGFSMNADASGEFGLGVAVDGVEVGIGISGTSGGYLDFAYESFKVTAGVNRTTKTGSFDFDYDGKGFGINVGKTSGDLNLRLSPTRKFEAGFNSAGSAYIGLQYDDNMFRLAGDKVTKSGSLEAAFGEIELSLAANAQEGSASAILKMPNFLLDIGGKKGKGGNFNLATSDFSLDIEADIEEKSGALGFSFDGGNKAFRAELDGGSTGKISFKHNEIEFGIGGNADGSAGSVMYKDGSNEFEVAVDKNAGTGALTLLIDGNGIESAVEADTAYVSFKYDNYLFGVGATPAGAGAISFSDGSTSFALAGNPDEKSGSFNLEFNGNKVALATNLTTKKHSFLVEAGDVSFNAKSEDNNFEVGLGYQNHEVKLSKGGSAGSTDGSSGSVSYTDGTNTFALAADPDARTGSLTIDLNGNGVKTAIDPDSSFVEFKYEGYEFISGLSSSGNGVVKYSQPNNSFELSGNPTQQRGAVELNIGSNKLAVSTDIPAKTHSIEIATSEAKFVASTSPSTKNLSLEYGNYAVFAKKSSDDYGVGLTINGRSIEGGIDNNIKFINYKGDGVEIGIASNKISLKKGTNSLEVTEEDIFIDGTSVQDLLANATATYTKTIGGLTATIVLNAGEYSVAFSSGGNGVKVTTSDFANGEVEVTINGTPVTISKDNEKYSLAVNDYEAIYEPGNLTLKKGADRSINVTGDALAVAFDGYNVSVSASELKYDDGQNSGSLSAEGLELKRDEYELFVSEAEFGLKMGATKSLELTKTSIAVNYDDFKASYTQGESIEVGYDDYMMAFTDGKLSLSVGTGRNIEVGKDLLDIDFDGYNFNVTPTAFTFLNGDNKVSISENGLALAKGENKFFVGPEEFGIELGASKHVFLTKKSLDVKYDNYLASFSASNALSFSDGTRSFALSNEGLEMSDGNKSIAILDDNGFPAIALQSGNDKFELNQKGFAVEYGGKRYAVNETEYLTLDIDATRKVEIMNNGVKYVDGDYQFILGGSENYVELTDGTKSIALSQDDKLILKDGEYYASLSKQLAVEFRDGTRTVKLFDNKHYLSYEQGSYKFGIRGANGAKPGLDFSYDDYSFSVEGDRNKNVTVGVTAPQFGTISATVNSQKDITATYRADASSVYGFLVDNGKLQLVNGTLNPPVPEQLDGAPSIPAQDGPQHLTNSISADAGGSIIGTCNIFFDSRASRFMLSAAVAGNSPVCIKGAMALDISPGQFHLDLGTEQQRIEVYPLCSGFGGGGWLGIHNTNVDLGVFVGWKASASVSIGSDVIGAKLTAAASAELGVKCNLDLDPFKINRAGVWVEIYAGIYAKYWAVGVSGSLTIAEIYLKGTLDVEFNDKTKVSGSLDGRINLLDIITASFGMSFSAEI